MSSFQFPCHLTGFQNGDFSAFLWNSGIICSVIVALKCIKGVVVFSDHIIYTVSQPNTYTLSTEIKEAII